MMYKFQLTLGGVFYPVIVGTVFLLATIFSSFSILATPVPIRLDVNNGLPSNHIYRMLVDRNGYLWLATPQGAVRYNGYETIVFDLSSGLPSNDVWNLHEDNQGRIWIQCICPSLGYIYDNRYKDVVIEHPPAQLYPRMWNYEHGILLYSQYDHNSQGKIFIEKNDTLYGYNAGSIISLLFDSQKREVICVEKLTDDLVYPKSVYKKGFSSGHIIQEDRFLYPVQKPVGALIGSFSKYIIHKGLRGNELVIFDVINASWQVITLPETDGSLQASVFNALDTTLYMAAGGSLYRFDVTDSFRQTRKYDIKGAMSSAVSNVLHDTLWGACIGTFDQGIYLRYSNDAVFTPKADHLTGAYRYAGHGYGNRHFWWNRVNHTLAAVDAAGKIMYRSYRDMATILKIVPWNDRESLLLHMNTLYLLDHQTGTITPFFQHKNLSPHNDPLLNKYLEDNHLMRYLDIAIADTNELFLLSRSGLYRIYREAAGFSAQLLQYGQGKRTTELFTEIVYDPVQQVVWAYNSNSVMRYNRDGSSIIVPHDRLGTPIFHNIEKLFVDTRYGNIFMKEFDRLTVFNIYTGRYRRLYPELNLEKSQVCLRDDWLIVAGRFGVTADKITGTNTIRRGAFYENVKSSYYKDVLDVHLTATEIIMNTDRGILSVPLPGGEQDTDIYPGFRQLPYHFLLGYQGHWRQLHHGDTLMLDQDNMQLRLDIVRPSGNGKLKYQYRLGNNDGVWEILHGNELMLSGLIPGKPVWLSIQATDQVWKSKEMDICLYMVPYWWQTDTARKIIWITGLFTVVALIYGIIWITKRIVVRNNFRRNMHMQMELKSIYAQINPHFIFNTLNSALLLIKAKKNQDAYRHVSKFSRLLRAYIKSSRNRFITIAEETENLRNYIELQQIRFKDKFDYEIVLDDSSEVRSMRIPSLLLQPIVENAVSHGLLNKKDKGMLRIHFKKGTGEQSVICTIEDDGVGRKETKQLRDSSSLKSESYGDLLIEDLVRVFNKYEGTNIRIVYTDKVPPLSGVLVTIYIEKTI